MNTFTNKYITTTIVFFLLASTMTAQGTDYTQHLNGGVGDNFPCDTSAHFSVANNLPFVTMLGDSLGDFVDSPIHGVFWWSFYLKHARPDIPNWTVQNFATGGYTTVRMFKDIRECIKPNIRKTFKTSNHVAFEIGGNDAMFTSFIVRIMPWKLFSYHDPLTGNKVSGVIDRLAYNIKSTIRYLRHPMIDKDVLVIGNFTALTTSPSLGEIGDYYELIKKLFDDFYLKEKPETIDLSSNVTNQIVDRWLIEFVALTGGIGPLAIIAAAEEVYNKVKLEQHNQKYSNDFQRWYVQWLVATRDIQTVLSITMFLMQNPIIEVVAGENVETENWVMSVKATPVAEDNTMVQVPNRPMPAAGQKFVNFLPMYEYYVYWSDCFIGACYVGNPILFRDPAPGHINAFGYFIWPIKWLTK